MFWCVRRSHSFCHATLGRVRGAGKRRVDEKDGAALARMKLPWAERMQHDTEARGKVPTCPVSGAVIGTKDGVAVVEQALIRLRQAAERADDVVHCGEDGSVPATQVEGLSCAETTECLRLFDVLNVAEMLEAPLIAVHVSARIASLVCKCSDVDRSRLLCGKVTGANVLSGSREVQQTVSERAWQAALTG